jgi:hypothetical protein
LQVAITTKKSEDLEREKFSGKIKHTRKFAEKIRRENYKTKRKKKIESMATPLIPQQLLDGGGGVAVLSNLVPSSSSSTSSNGGGGFNRSSLSESPILIFSFFQKAIRNELDALHRLALAFATGNRSDIQPLSERYHFLRSMYKHHSNAEDEVQSFRIYFSEIFVSFFG